MRWLDLARYRQCKCKDLHLLVSLVWWCEHVDHPMRRPSEKNKQKLLILYFTRIKVSTEEQWILDEFNKWTHFLSSSPQQQMLILFYRKKYHSIVFITISFNAVLPRLHKFLQELLNQLTAFVLTKGKRWWECPFDL